LAPFASHVAAAARMTTRASSCTIFLFIGIPNLRLFACSGPGFNSNLAPYFPGQIRSFGLKVQQTSVQRNLLMEIQGHSVKMVSIDAEQLESIGYSDGTRTLYIKFRNSPALQFEKVPRFRYQGLMSAPRKDAYFKTFIQNQFLTKPV
jgi:hypothetical protein